VSACADNETLLRYQNGKLDDDEAGRIERHLHTCASCRGLMDRIREANADERVVRTVFKAGPSDGVVSKDPVPTPGDGADWIIPDYERVLLCGEGSYGSVWVVRDRVGVHRALKMIDLGRLREAGLMCRERNALEAYCRKVGRHASLINIYHVGEAGPYLYYTMDLADDRGTRAPIRDQIPADYRPLTLQTIIEDRRLKVDATLEIIRRLLCGLARLHELDLVHRDVKPSNIVFVNGYPKLADIGILTAHPSKGKLIGTPRYMPPDRVMDQTGDVYAIGKVLHEMLAGRDAATFPALPEDRLWGSMRWDLARVSDVLVHACADAAAGRYPNATIMLDDLEASARLSYDSLFDEVAEPIPEERESDIMIELGFAFARAIPWILGFIVVMYALSKI
jgi:serine/threonine protein kinase